ncbi:hypothetical protein DFS33DRAFT_1115379 [Desarmillaria ectypa]|nr:hypothetical protein DFS33DRAFT_1115379 [Desarmillaria ectypa]
MSRIDKTQFDPSFASFLPDFHQPIRSAQITELLSHNNSPTDSQHVYLQYVISEGESARAVLDQKVSVASQLLKALEVERDQAIADVVDAILHPVLKVPDDILYNIFAICVNLDRNSRDPSSYGVDIPWTLSQVRRNWRTISIRTPKLWTFVRLDIQYETPRRIRHLLLKQLERARDFDLELRTCGDVSDHPIFRALLTSASYWRKVNLDILGDKELEAIRQSGITLSRLQSLNIALTNDDFPIGCYDLFSVFEASLGLRRPSVDIYVDEGWEIVGHSPTLFARITHLNIGSRLTTSFFFIHILPHMHNLEWLALVGAYDQPVPSIELPNLLSLYIRGVRYARHGSADTHSDLTVPALQTLELKVSPASYPTVAQPNSITRLRLSLEGPMLEPDGIQDLIDFLRTLPELRYLLLPCKYVPHDFLIEMSALPDVVPHLEHIHMVTCYGMQTAIFEFARSRWMTGNLSKVTLGEGYRIEQWWALCDEGLLVELDQSWERWKYSNVVQWDRA